VPNGVDVDRLASPVSRRGYALALGRICPEKGFHVALDAARIAGVPLLLAGEVYPYPEHERYFRDEIAPRLDRRRKFVGPAGFARKRRLLSGARCLLVPSLAPETSSLVAMEALACGTPVIAHRTGALPGIVEHCRTGFLVDGADEMARAIRAASSIDPEACRRAARERFSSAGMIELYLETYRLLADPERLAAAAAGGALEHAA
jgi:glycosyltransferase involved in cell wall biosynthesis